MDENPRFTLETPISEMLPHRYPFLLVDRVIEVDPFKSLLAIKNVSVNEPVFQGHFPERPIYPGVYLIEGMAQASALLGALSQHVPANFLLTQIQDSRFKKLVIPGDCLHYEVSFVKKKRSFSWFNGTVKVNSEVVASASLSAYMP